MTPFHCQDIDKLLLKNLQRRKDQANFRMFVEANKTAVYDENRKLIHCITKNGQGCEVAQMKNWSIVRGSSFADIEHILRNH